MCICLPNGKFNFKFSRSNSGLAKKDGKGKRVLSIISESSEEEDARDKLSPSLKNGVKRDKHKQINGELDKNQGNIRQLSRDRQLPPVPDTCDFSTLQINSPRKSIAKNNINAYSLAGGKSDQFLTTHQREDYGNVYEAETYPESKSATQSQANHFLLASMEYGREVDPLYASVLPQPCRQSMNQAPKIEQERLSKDYYPEKASNDYLYSTIMKKDFSSLRKPARPRSSVRDCHYQSLQSLNNQAPGLPLRLYKLSELAHLNNQALLLDTNIKLRKSSAGDSRSSLLRRFSQPTSSNGDTNYPHKVNEESQRDVDVLRRLQSQYNTPPLKRASISDVRQLHLDLSDSPHHSRCLSDIDPVMPYSVFKHVPSDNDDFYRHITVRESLASLRARNALPDSSLSFENPANIETRILPQVYEGLYETLYYSSAEPGRTGPGPEETFSGPPPVTERPNPLSYLGQDNYLSITDNTLSASSNGQGAVFPNRSSARPSQDRSSVIYATTGSEVYAEISDAYLSRQYEELPEQKQNIKDSSVGSPGTLRVLLEIQSFRHMDSDVDVSSRCTTPLHPLARPVTGTSKASQMKTPDNNNTIPYANNIRHPWFLPQRSLDNQAVLQARSAASSVLTSPGAVKQKPSQNHLAIMTPLMERSMEGSSMFLDDNRNCEHAPDPGHDRSKVCSHKDALQHEVPAKDPNGHLSRKNKRILYPSFSNSHALENGDRNHPFA